MFSTTRFSEIRTLGKGEISEVILAKDTQMNNNLVAIKRLCKLKLNTILRRKLLTEISILERLTELHSEWFVELIEVLEDNQNIYLIMEYINGIELFDFVGDYFGFGVPEVLCNQILRQIFTAVSQLHTINIAHLDLKLENIMYNQTTGKIKIIDFGYASTTEEKIKEYSGSVHYIAPQLLHQSPYDGQKADMWSLGVVSFALLAAHFPFDDPNDDKAQIYFNIKRGIFKIPLHFSSQAKTFVERLLEPNEKKRPTSAEMLYSPFLTPIPLC